MGKYSMNYKLYTLVDITHTGQYRNEIGKEDLRYKEQNFNTVLQTLGLRSNVYYDYSPRVLEVKGSVVGFNTEEVIRVWRFDWRTESDTAYLVNGDPVGFLKTDFHLVPYISNLSELMVQRYAVFTTAEPGSNIVFDVKQ